MMRSSFSGWFPIHFLVLSIEMIIWIRFRRPTLTSSSMVSSSSMLSSSSSSMFGDKSSVTFVASVKSLREVPLREFLFLFQRLNGQKFVKCPQVSEDFCRGRAKIKLAILGDSDQYISYNENRYFCLYWFHTHCTEIHIEEKRKKTTLSF